MGRIASPGWSRIPDGWWRGRNAVTVPPVLPSQTRPARTEAAADVEAPNMMVDDG